MQKSCGNCEHFRRQHPKQNGGTCHRMPPVPCFVGMLQHPVSGQQMPHAPSFWPMLDASERCGEWQPRDPAQKVPQIDLGKLDVTELEGSA